MCCCFFFFAHPSTPKPTKELPRTPTTVSILTSVTINKVYHDLRFMLAFDCLKAELLNEFVGGVSIQEDNPTTNIRSRFFPTVFFFLPPSYITHLFWDSGKTVARGAFKSSSQLIESGRVSAFQCVSSEISARGGKNEGDTALIRTTAGLVGSRLTFLESGKKNNRTRNVFGESFFFKTANSITIITILSVSLFCGLFLFCWHFFPPYFPESRAFEQIKSTWIGLNIWIMSLGKFHFEQMLLVATNNRIFD